MEEESVGRVADALAEASFAARTPRPVPTSTLASTPASDGSVKAELGPFTSDALTRALMGGMLICAAVIYFIVRA